MRRAAEEYASMVDKLDRQVGAILAQVHKLGLEKRTIIVFSSDNGHELYYRTDKERSAASTATAAFWTAPGSCWTFSAAAAGSSAKRTPWSTWPG